MCQLPGASCLQSALKVLVTTFHLDPMPARTTGFDLGHTAQSTLAQLQIARAFNCVYLRPGTQGFAEGNKGARGSRHSKEITRCLCGRCLMSTMNVDLHL